MTDSQKYPHYKPSGVIWLGEVPEHWEVRRLKNVCEINQNSLPEDSSKTLEFKYVDIGSVTFEKGITQTETFVFKNAPSRARRLAKVGDTVVSTVRTYLKAIDFVDEKKSGFVFSTGFAVLSPLKIDPNFLSCFAKSDAFTNQVDVFSKGMSYPAINSTDLGNLHLPLPPLPEQTRIANYLDQKTTQIDRAIAQKQALIELLRERRQGIIHRAVTRGLDDSVKMKDSGVAWIGEVPEHWEVKRLKEICKAFGRIGFRGYTTADLVAEDEGAITISPSNIKEEEMTFEKSSFLNWKKYEESPEIQIFENDILIVKTGSTFGKVGIVKNLPRPATINPQLLVLKDIKVDHEYLYALLK